eukprot:scaffold6168_cov420-Prasinococcus_capsulatus_cf.AAC.7
MVAYTHARAYPAAQTPTPQQRIVAGPPLPEGRIIFLQSVVGEPFNPLLNVSYSAWSVTSLLCL